MFSLFSYLQNISQIKEKLKHSCLKLSALWVFEFRQVVLRLDSLMNSSVTNIVLGLIFINICDYVPLCHSEYKNLYLYINFTLNI